MQVPIKEQGRIKFWNKQRAYGYITRSEKQDAFFGEECFVENTFKDFPLVIRGLKNLPVQFNTVNTPRGTKAINIEIIESERQ